MMQKADKEIHPLATACTDAEPVQRGKDSGYGGCVAERPAGLDRCHGKEGRIPAMAGVLLDGPQILVGAMANREGFRLWQV